MATQESPPIGTQLSLSIAKPARATLVLASVSELARHGLEASLRKFAVRRFVDLRLGPLYRPFGLDREGFTELLSSLGVQYEHLTALADPHMGDAWHEERYRQLIERHYEEHVDEVRALRRLAEDGPLMLLVASYVELGQRALLRALQSNAAGLDCVQLGA